MPPESTFTPIAQDPARTSRPGLPARAAAAGTVLFVLFSSVVLLIGGGSLLAGVNSSFHIMSGHSEQGPVHSWGLAFLGVGGGVMAIGEGVLALAALLLAVFGRGAWRRLGVAAVFAWAALWTVNATRLLILDGQQMWWAVGAGMWAVFVCICVWARDKWRTPGAG